jgi:phosphoglycerol transferase MdoB-like AlkP superfamily enzyme
MILGMSLQTFTVLHVIISLIAIVAGVVVLIDMLGSKRREGWTGLFLLMTILTSVTGFMFPISGFTPALGVGVISLLVLLIALVALYGKHLNGSWRWIYVAAALTALWFNVFVLIAQAFMKVPLLHPLAPNGNEPPFLIVQTVALVIFVVLGLIAAFKFRPGPAMPV